MTGTRADGRHPIKVAAHGVTHPGLVRTTNEDSYYCDPGQGLFVVADGMGGHNGGEVASRMAVEAIRGFLEVSGRDDDVTWPFGVDAELDHDGNRVATAIRLANRLVFDEASARAEYRGMGTTVVVVVITGNVATFGSIGDSRLYVMREGRLDQLTRDDTWIATVLAQDANADPAALAHHPMRHVLTDAVGTDQDAALVVQRQDLAAGDVLLLCSDGLHGRVPDADILRLLANDSASPERAGAALVEAALATGAPDNVTAVVLRVI